MRAEEFKNQNRYEKVGENNTMFTQMVTGYRNKFNWLRIKDRRFMTVSFKGEAACDCGGPMRDVISNVCDDVMSPVLPLLIPTANNIAKVEPEADCYKLNPSATEPFILKKYSFLGYFLGWSLRNMGGLGIDLPSAFWKRVCGGPNYIYSLEDLKSMDKFRYTTLKQIKESADSLDKNEFNYAYDGTCFEAIFDGNDENISLCDGGPKILLTKDNADDYVQLYLKKYTELENLQFNMIF